MGVLARRMAPSPAGKVREVESEGRMQRFTVHPDSPQGQSQCLPVL